MAQWNIRTVVGGAVRDVIVESDSQPGVFSGPLPQPPPDVYQPVVAAANNFLTARANFLASIKAQLAANPPYSPAGPVPTGYSWWVCTGFIQNVPKPYASTDLGIGVILVWAPAGSAAPAEDYS